MYLTARHYSLALVLVLLVAMMPAAVVYSLEPANTATANVTVRVRSGPGTGHPQVGVILAQKVVPLKGRNADTSWLYVEYKPGATGWVAAWLMTVNGDASQVPVVEPGGAPTQPSALPPAAPMTTGRTVSPVNLRPAPNTSQPPITVIPGGKTVDVYGRNAAATWLYVTYQGQPGWVSASYVVLASVTRSALPIMPTTPTGPGPAPVPTAAPPSSYSPYIHNMSPHARQIFLDGQAKGNRANVFSKAGDSITVSWAFLNKIGDGIYTLHDYAHLQPVITYFSAAQARTGNSFNNASLAAVEGWTTFDLLDPARTDPMCPGLSPLACEYHMVRPALAIIMIGTNDTGRGLDRGASAQNLRQIVALSIQYGVIPVLSTIPYNQYGDAEAYNQVVISIATEYDIPWMDFYAATVNLPNHGNDPDGVHPSVPPTNDPTNFTPQNLQYGHTVRNLLTLHMLDALWRQVLTP